MPSHRYRKYAEECLDRAVQTPKSEDVDAWLLIAEEWLKLALESEAADRQQRQWGQEPTFLPSTWSPVFVALEFELP